MTTVIPKLNPGESPRLQPRPSRLSVESTNGKTNGTLGSPKPALRRGPSTKNLTPRSIRDGRAFTVQFNDLADEHMYTEHGPFKTTFRCRETYMESTFGHEAIFVRHFVPRLRPTIGTIVLCHGYGEHSGRYGHVCNWFVQEGYQVFAYDHYAHGKSDGSDGAATVIKSFDVFIDDCVKLVNYIEAKFPDQPYFLFGHSMGGLIAAQAALKLQERRNPDTGARQPWKCKGVVFSSPAFRVEGNCLAPCPYACFFRGLANCMSCLLPCLPTPGAPTKLLSRSPEVRRDAAQDPLTFGDTINNRFGNLLVKSSADMQQRYSEFQTPFSLHIGTGDGICSPQAMHAFAAGASTPKQDQSVKSYPGLYHELLNEPERKDVFRDMMAWIRDRTKSSSQ